MSVQGLHKDHTYLWWTVHPSNSVHAADCSVLSQMWCLHQLLCCTSRVPVLSN